MYLHDFLSKSNTVRRWYATESRKLCYSGSMHGLWHLICCFPLTTKPHISNCRLHPTLPCPCPLSSPHNAQSIPYRRPLAPRRRSNTLEPSSSSWPLCFLVWLPTDRSVAHRIASYYSLCSHSVLEQIWVKGTYLDQRLPQHESL